MDALLNPSLGSRVDALAAEFQNADPFRHVVIEDFFAPDFCQRLLNDFPGFEDRFALNEMGQVGGKAVRMDVRDISDSYRQLDRCIQTPAFLELISAITGIPDLLYDTDYVGGGTHENRDGQGLDPHVDFNYHPGTGWHRRLNLIVYLNPEWQEAWGGNIEFHSDPWSSESNRIKRVLPLFNRAVIFETNEISWHGFSAIRLPEERKDISRRSFAIYLYTRERPAAERAESHATVYVPEGLPADLAAGETLSESRVQDLRQRFQRLSQQLRFLYDREKQFSAQIASLETALAEARAAQRCDLQGHVRQEGVEGLWPDGWAARSVRVRFTPTRPAAGLVLKLWLPDALKDGQKLSLKLGEHSETVQLAPGRVREIRLQQRLVSEAPVELRIEASRDWRPAGEGQSGDHRGLAWKWVGMVVE